MNSSEFLRLILSSFIFGFIIFHRKLICYELRKSFRKGVGTQAFLSQACAAISEWFLELKNTAFFFFGFLTVTNIMIE